MNQAEVPNETELAELGHLLLTWDRKDDAGIDRFSEESRNNFVEVEKVTPV